MDYYVDSAAGNDNNAGTSPDTPWKTIARVNSFFAGDQSGNRVRFRAGRGWREQLDFNGNAVHGSPGAPFVITRYGDGPLPSINGADRVTGWVPYWGDIWAKTGLSDIQDVFYGGTRVIKSASIETLQQNRSFYDVADGTMYVWLPNNLNPNDVQVQLTARNYGIRLKTTSGYVVIENIYASRARFVAISVYVDRNIPTSDVTVQNCHAAFAGVDGQIRVGSSDGIAVYGPRPNFRLLNARIVNNYSHHNYNCAIEIGNHDGAYIAGNRLEHCSNGFEVWQECSNVVFERNAVSHMNNERQQNRLFKEAGCWVHAEPGTGESTNNRFFKNVFTNCRKGIQIWVGDAEIAQNTIVDARWMAVDIKNTDNSIINVNNNMMVVNRTDNRGPGVYVYKTAAGAAFSADNNCFYAPNSQIQETRFQIDNTLVDFEDWKLLTGQDGNSFEAVAVQPSEAPISANIPGDGAWWIVK